MAEDLLVGTWRLRSARFTDASGAESHPWGANPKGVVTYGPAGHMSVQLMRSDRSHFATNDPAAGSVKEISSAFGGLMTYYGSYAIAGTTVTHTIEGCSFPNWEGTELTREFAVDGDVLTLTTAPMRVAGEEVTGILAWKRIR